MIMVFDLGEENNFWLELSRGSKKWGFKKFCRGEQKINPACFVVVLSQITPLVIDILFHLCDLEHRRGYVQPDTAMAAHSFYIML